MANDWLKMMHDLAEKPETVGISAQTGIDIFGVVGRLHRIWTWFDRHTLDGTASGVMPSFLDSLVAHEGFASAMISVGWLVQRNRRIAIPNFDRHISKSAKARALASERMKRSRDAASATETQLEQSKQRTEKDSALESQSPERSKPAMRSAGSGRSKNGRPGDLTAEVIADPVLFRGWVEREKSLHLRRKYSLVRSEDAESLAYAAREKAVSDKSVIVPPAWLKGVLLTHLEGNTGEAWSRVRAEHEDAAKRCRAAVVPAVLANFGAMPSEGGAA